MILEFNEKKYAENMLQNGFIKNKILFELRILAKYFFYLGKNRNDVRQNVVQFCEHYCPNFNEIKYRKLINDVCNYAKNNKLIKINSVLISNEELNKIKSLNDLKLEKLMFVMLVICKCYNEILNSNNNKVYANLTDLFSLAKLNIRVSARQKMIKELIDKEFITMSLNCNYTVKICDKHCTNIGIEINDFNNFVWIYEDYLGLIKIKDCVVCGDRIKANSSNHRYCAKCKKEKNRETDRLKKRKKRLLDKGK